METRSNSKLRDSKPPPRATTAGGTQPVKTDIVTSVIQHVEPPSSATGHARNGKHSSRCSSLEAGPRRTYSHAPRIESTAGARGSAEGFAFCQDLETTSIVENGKFFHRTPDEGATFTLWNRQTGALLLQLRTRLVVSLQMPVHVVCQTPVLTSTLGRPL